jgi:hypothetical protein
VSDLTEFLLARIAEDEAAAQAAYPGGRWEVAANGHEGHSIRALDVHAFELPDVPETVVDDEGGAIPPDITTMRHIALWDPARVLAECEAKRRTIELATVVGRMDRQIQAEWGVPPIEPEDDVELKLLRALALPYANHPDYRQERKP